MASDEQDGEVKTFKSLGLCDKLVEAVAKLNWKNPTPIQVEAIPHALEGSLNLIPPSFSYKVSIFSGFRVRIFQFKY